MYTNRLAAVFLTVCNIVLPSVSVLAQKAPTQGGFGHTILFVCEHGSAKSVIAAAHFNDLANKNGLPYRAIAQGIHPDKEIPHYVKSGLAAEGLSIRRWRPTRFSEEDALKVVFAPIASPSVSTVVAANSADRRARQCAPVRLLEVYPSFTDRRVAAPIYIPVRR